MVESILFGRIVEGSMMVRTRTHEILERRGERFFIRGTEIPVDRIAKLREGQGWSPEAIAANLSLPLETIRGVLRWLAHRGELPTMGETTAAGPGA